MQLRSLARSLTPCSLVLVIFPVWFLLMPDGVPFVYANCGAGLTGHVSNMQGASLTPLYDATHPAAIVDSYTLDNSSLACEFTVSVAFRLFNPAGTEPRCDASRWRLCKDPVNNCQPTGDVFAGNGAGSYTLSNYTNQCNATGDTNQIDLQVANCNALNGNNNGIFFSSTASSSNCSST